MQPVRFYKNGMKESDNRSLRCAIDEHDGGETTCSELFKNAVYFKDY